MTDSQLIAERKRRRKCRNRDLLHKFYNDAADLLPQQQTETTEKSNERSNKLRIEGHEHFLNHLYVNAIDAYNESLCHAEITGDKFNLSMAFGHRAEALFRMKLFHECLTSIKLALASSYPEQLKKRMTVLQRMCREEIENEDAPKVVLDYAVKLTHPARDHLPSAIADLKLRKSRKYGRHIVTQRDLCVGDVIAIEDAYLSELKPTDRYKRCANCLSEQRHALFPCSFCTNVLFCSQKCEKDSWSVFHRYECSISDYLLTIESTARVAIKALLLGLSLFKDLRAMKQFLEKSEPREFSVLDPDFRHDDAKDQFLAFYKLYNNDDHLDSRRRRGNMKRCAEILCILKQQNDLSEKLEGVGDVFLLEFLYNVICIHLNNGFDIGCSPFNRCSSIGGGVFPLFSLANHSCAPNVMRIQKGSRQFWIVNRVIQKGAQVFDNYGMCFLADDLTARQKRCRQVYGFKCRCEACAMDYPMFGDVEVEEFVPDFHLQETIADYQEHKSLLKQLDCVATFMQVHDGYYPCKQLEDANDVLCQIYKTILDDSSMEVKFVQFYKAKEE